jgi:gliding motility associated protien GldN
MRNVCYVIVFASLLLCGVNVSSYAQESASGYNPNSVYPIHDSNIMWKKRVWRRMDLNEKANRPFFAYNNEITKIIIEATKAGLIFPYENDSLKTRMSKEKFLENLIDPRTIPVDDDDFGFDSGDDGWGANNEEKVSTGPAEFFPNQITVMEIMEDMIFDKNRSRLYYDIQAVTLILPAKLFETGMLKPVATYKFKDLVQLFRSMPEEAIWFNRQNHRQHRNLADAFDLRLFSARIIKVGNPDDHSIVDVYNKSPKEGIMASQWLENELMEFEHELWEF